MAHQTQLVADAIVDLLDLARTLPQGARHEFALAWLVGARMYQLSMLPPGDRLVSLTEKESWSSADAVVGKICTDVIWGRDAVTLLSASTLDDAARIVGRLIDRAPDFYLYVADALWGLQLPRDANWPVVSPQVCNLLFSALDAPEGSVVWLPFDPIGQLGSLAVRLGLKPFTAGPQAWTTDSQTLFRALSGDFTTRSTESTYPPRGADGKRDFAVDYLVAVPPLADRLSHQISWYEWEGDDATLSKVRGLVQRLGLPSHLRLDRSDTWAPAALWPRVKRNAVFLATHSILFSRGQEQRLREVWIRSGYPIKTVITLPAKMLAHTNVQTALLVFSAETRRNRLVMADFGDLTMRSAVGARHSKIFNLRQAGELLNLPRLYKDLEIRQDPREDNEASLEPNEGSKKVREVTFDEILDGNCSLQPSRYLLPPLELQGERARLRDLVEVIRAPLQSDDPFCVNAVEIGIPELDGWRPLTIGAPSPEKNLRMVSLRERRLEDACLRRGDIVMSIKGTRETIGRTALIGQDKIHSGADSARQERWSLVTSGNCVALRLRDRQISSEYLLLYFRSREFRQQLESLMVGAVIPHVTPGDLCDDVRIPVPSKSEQAEMREKYERLCDLEDQAMAAHRRIGEIVSSLWTTR